jgi:hypothetical protein
MFFTFHTSQRSIQKLQKSMYYQRTEKIKLVANLKKKNDINERMPVPNTAYTQWRVKCNK